MLSVYEVAKYILDHTDNITTMKLQKLVYYAQAWHLVWEDEPLFLERIEAWANGPVCKDLYAKHKGYYKTDKLLRDYTTDNITENQKESIDQVIKYYGKYTSRELSDITHKEDPWLFARERAGVSLGQPCNEEILHSDMLEYYTTIANA